MHFSKVSHKASTSVVFVNFVLVLKSFFRRLRRLRRRQLRQVTPDKPELRRTSRNVPLPTYISQFLLFLKLEVFINPTNTHTYAQDSF